jgi:hypothetical protein
VNAREFLALTLDPSRILKAQGMEPDPWQRDLLLSEARHLLLNCSRGAGKSRVTSALALHAALCRPPSLVLLISRTQRQAGELFRYVKQGYGALGRPIKAVKETETVLELRNGSRVVSLPGTEATIRSFQGVNLLVLDEAARIPDVLYASVSPMTGVALGRTVCLSTPFGQRGFFWKEWHNPLAPWVRFEVPWQKCPRLKQEFIDEEKRKFGESWVRQEYEGSFVALEGLVYPDFAATLVEDWPDPKGRAVGGIDWGWRNPFAALWGVLDRDDVLWIAGERYATATPLHEHIAGLPGKVTWYADPSGATEIAACRAAGLTVRRADNDIRSGIAAVTARLRTGRLKVHVDACPNLVREARLYRYPTEQERALIGENPVDEHNHALGALRYLISRLDAHRLGKLRDKPPAEEAPPEPPRHDGLDNPDLWTPIR